MRSNPASPVAILRDVFDKSPGLVVPAWLPLTFSGDGSNADYTITAPQLHESLGLGKRGAAFICASIQSPAADSVITAKLEGESLFKNQINGADVFDDPTADDEPMLPCPFAILADQVFTVIGSSATAALRQRSIAMYGYRVHPEAVKRLQGEWGFPTAITVDTGALTTNGDHDAPDHVVSQDLDLDTVVGVLTEAGGGLCDQVELEVESERYALRGGALTPPRFPSQVGALINRHVRKGAVINLDTTWSSMGTGRLRLTFRGRRREF